MDWVLELLAFRGGVAVCRPILHEVGTLFEHGGSTVRRFGLVLDGMRECCFGNITRIAGAVRSPVPKGAAEPVARLPRM